MSREVDEKEVLDHDEEAVSRLVAELERVEAPPSFERRVMSRLAESEPPARSLFAVQTLVYVAPAILVLLVGAFYVFRFRQQAAQPDTVAQTPAAVQTTYPDSPSQIPPPQPQASQTTDELAQTESEKRAPSTVAERLQRMHHSDVTNSNNGGGSITFGQDQAKQQFPEGLNPRTARSNVNPKEIVGQTTVPVQDILTMLGISAEYKNEWLVRSVSKNSSGEHSGVQAGDVLVAINDAQLTAETRYHGASNFSTITVRREGKSLTLKLK